MDPRNDPGLHSQLAAAAARRTVLSACRAYRYALWRCWTGGESCVLFIGLNPSTADEGLDDPTLARCRSFARDWGFGAVCMVNLFAFRATRPADLKRAVDPVGPHNDRFIETLSRDAELIVAAWGGDQWCLPRARTVTELVRRPLHCLKLNRSGSPAHPLYLKRGLSPLPWKA